MPWLSRFLITLLMWLPLLSGSGTFRINSRALQEMGRVVVPGGQVMVLEMTFPRSSLFQGFYHLYLNRILPGIARAFSRNPAAYEYLADSIMNFPDPEAFSRMMEEAGLVRVEKYPLDFGITYLHIGVKPSLLKTVHLAISTIIAGCLMLGIGLNEFTSACHMLRIGRMRLWGNDYNKMEFAGAFGDLGTLIPFAVGYITLNKMDPSRDSRCLRIFKIFAGLYFKTPVPIQPMKAIGGMAISHAGTITPGMIWGSGIFTGLFWLLMGRHRSDHLDREGDDQTRGPGNHAGTGLSFIGEGLGMMRQQPLYAIGGIVLTFLLLDNRRVPAMLVLLGYGVLVAFLQKPELFGELSNLSIRFRWPEPALGKISWKDLLAGFVLLGLPQAPLTLGNAIIGTCAENNAHFPDRKVKAKTISIDHGVMNLISACIGGVPTVPWGRRHGRPYPIWREDRRGIGDPGRDRSHDRTLSE